MKNHSQLYIVHPAVFTPVLLSALFIAWAFESSWWFLAALPVVWICSACASPNLNLADGCLAYLLMFAGFAIIPFLKPLGLAIVFGALSSYCAATFEKRLRIRPAPPDSSPH